MPTFNSGQEVIQAFMRSLDTTSLKGKNALDQAVRACSNYSGVDDLINNFVADCRNAVSGDAFLRNYCGIILDNDDTGAISGSDAGGNTVKNAVDIVPETGSVQSFTGTTFTRNGLTINVPNQSSITGTQQTILNGLYTWWIGEGLNLISSSYGSNYGFTSASSASVKSIRVYFDYDYDNTLAYVTHWYMPSSGVATDLELHINMRYYNNLVDTVNGLSSDASAGYLDRTLAHEFTHAVMAANITNFNSLPQCIKEGMAELTHGIDDFRTYTINKLANNSSLLRASVNVSDTGTGTNDAYAGGYMLLRYLAKQASTGTSPALDYNVIVNDKSGTLVSGSSDRDSILNQSTGSRATLIGGLGNDTIDNRGDYSVINAGSGNDIVYSNRDSMYGWSATVNGGLGNDTVTGSRYGDLFQYSSGDGNDSITNWDANDTLQILTGSIDRTLASGSNVLVTVGSGVITLKGATASTLRIVDANGNAISPSSTLNNVIHNWNINSVVSGSANADTVNNHAGGAKVYGGLGNDSIYNSTNSDYTINNSYGFVTVDGGYGNDSIISNDPNVSLGGGEGNDFITTGDWDGVTVRGGTGNDTIRGTTRGTLYQYSSGDGNDILTNYSVNDTIQILSGAFNGTTSSGSDLIVSVGGGFIRLQNALGKSVRLVDGNGTSISVTPDTVDRAINNYNLHSLVSGGTGKDTIRNYAGDVTIQAGGGNDHVYNSTGSSHTVNNSYGFVTIDAGAGNDTVESYDPFVSINGGAGNDTIYTSNWSNVTVEGGAGSDTIRGTGNYKVYKYASGDGNDLVYGYNSTDSVQIVSGSVKGASVDGNDYVIGVGSGYITLKNAANELLNLVDAAGNKISIGSSVRAVYNYNQNSLVSGSGGSDTIRNYAGGVTIRAGSGGDYIYNSTGSSHTVNNSYGYVTIDAGEGNDTVYSHDPNVSISGGAGADYLYSGSWSNVTVRGGLGNDSVYLNNGANNVIQYASGDGNDVVFGLDGDDTIRITDGSRYSTLTSGADVIVSIGSGSMTLKSAVGNALNISGGTLVTTGGGRYIYNSTQNTVVSGSDYGDTIVNSAYHVTVDAGGGNDTVNILVGDYMSVGGGAGNDSIFAASARWYDTFNGGTGNDTIGGDAWRKTIVYRSGDGNDLVSSFGSNDTLRLIDNPRYATIRSGDNLIVSIGSGSITLGGAASINAFISGGTLVGGDTSDTINFISNTTRASLVGGSSSVDAIFNSGSRSTIDAREGNDIIDNQGDYASINGGAGNDSITSNLNSMYGWYATIRGGLGNDTITGSRYADVFEFAAGDGNDLITNYDANDSIQIVGGADYLLSTVQNDVIVSVGSGSMRLKNAVGLPVNISKNNVIYNSSAFATVNGTANADSIQNTGGSVTINADDGNDTVDNRGDYASINGGAGNDSINSSVVSSWGWYATINGGTGNDTMIGSRYGDVFQYRAGDGNDVITNFDTNDTLSITDGSSYSTTASGNDVIVSVGSGSIRLKDAVDKTLNIINTRNITVPSSSTLVSGSSANESFFNAYSRVTINALDGNDIIDNQGDYASLSGGAGNDSINSSRNSSWGWYATINGGTGNDTLTGSRYGDVFQYRAGDGNDLITNFDSNDTLSILDGSSYATLVSGNDLIVSIGSGAITLGGQANASIKISGGTSVNPRNYIYNSTSNTVVSGSANADSIQNAAYYVTINAGAGNDTIYNYIGDYVSINAGDGNDSIYADSARWYDTFKGGKGNDTIDGTAYRKTIEYADGDGNDVITGYQSSDTIRITDGSSFSTVQSGNDVIVNVGSGSLTLKDAVGKTLNIFNGRTVYNTTSNTLISGSTSADSIVNTGSRVTINGDAGNDTVNNQGDNAIINAGAGNDYITGSSHADVFIYNEGDGNDTITNYDANDTISLSITEGTYSSTQTSGNDVIVNVGSGSIRLKNASGKRLNIVQPSTTTLNTIYNSTSNTLVNGSSGRDSIQNSGSRVTIEGDSGNDTINNQGDYALINAGAGNDSINSSVLSNWGWYATINGGLGNDTMIGSRYNDVFQYKSGDGNDVITNFDTNDTLSITDGSSYSTATSGSDVIVNVGSGSIRLQNASGKALNIINSNVISNSTYSTLVSGTELNDSIRNTGSYDTIEAGEGNDTIENRGDYNVIRGGAGNDSINSSVVSGWGWYATVEGGEGNDTMIGSSYADVYQYKSGDGNDVITNFDTNDTLSITDGSSFSTTASGSDVIVSIGSGSIRLKNAVGKALSIINSNVISNSTANTLVSGTSNSDLIQNTGSNVTIEAGDGDDTISNRGDRNLIFGGAGNDSINSSVVSGWGWYATINGGLGDDTMIGSDYADVFVYNDGDGNDLITNFGSNDTLRLDNGMSFSTIASGSDVLVSVGSGTITLRGASGKTLHIDDGSNIYNSTANTLVNGTRNSDSIENNANNVTINAGAGDDVIRNAYGDHVSINAGDGNDSIRNESGRWYTTIRGGLGDDTISGAGYYKVYEYASGDGFNVIENYDGTDTIRITDGAEYSTLKSGEDVYVLIGEGSIELRGAAGQQLNISGGTLNTRMIYNETPNTLVVGTDEADEIYNDAYNVTIEGGAGDDMLFGSQYEEVFRYGAGDGNDTVVGYDANDTIELAEGLSYRTVTSGEEDVLISMDGGSILLTGVNGAVNIIGGSNAGVSIRNENVNRTVNGSSGNDTIENLAGGVQIDAGDGNDTIYSRTENTVGGSEGNVTIAAGAGDDTVSNYSPNVSIDGGAGNDVIYTSSYSNVTVRGGAGDDTIAGSGSGRIYRYADGDGSDVVQGFDGSDTIEIIDGSSYSTLASDNNVLVSIGSGSMLLEDALGKTINVVGGTLEGGNGQFIANGADSIAVVGTSGDDSIINNGSGVTINAGLGDDTIDGSGTGRVIEYASGDGNDVVNAWSTSDTVSIVDGSEYATVRSGNDVVVSIGSGSIRLKDAVGQTINIIGGAIPAVETVSNVIYVSEDDATLENSRANVTIIGTMYDDTIENGGSNVLILESEGENSVRNDGSNATVQGGEDDDVIVNSGSGASILGGDGDDVLRTSASATLVGGDGDDAFGVSVSTSAISVGIVDLTEDDRLDIMSTNTSRLTYRLQNGGLILTDNTGLIELTLEGVTSFEEVRGIEVDFRNASGGLRSTTTLGRLTSADTSLPDGLKLNSSGKTLTIKAPFEGTVSAADYGDKVKTLNASTNRGAVGLIGNELDNVIKASKGGSTISGGGGKDKITLSDGADVIEYADGDGKDTIKKYASGDAIRITEGEIESVKIKGKHVVLEVGSGSMTVQKAVGQEMTIIDAGGEEGRYVFTKANNTLELARVSTNGELAASTEEYWFEEEVESDPIGEMLPIESTGNALEEKLFEGLNELQTPQLANADRKKK